MEVVLALSYSKFLRSYVLPAVPMRTIWFAELNLYIIYLERLAQEE